MSIKSGLRTIAIADPAACDHAYPVNLFAQLFSFYVLLVVQPILQTLLFICCRILYEEDLFEFGSTVIGGIGQDLDALD